MTVPGSFVVGATGRADGGAQERRRHGDLHLRAGRRPRFRLDGRPELRRRARDVLGRARSDAGRTGTHRDARSTGRSARCALRTSTSRCSCSRRTWPQAARHMRAVKAAVKEFGLWYGRYPYRDADRRRPARAAAKAPAGWSIRRSSPAARAALFNYWPLDRGAPAGTGRWSTSSAISSGTAWSRTNEFEEAWLDEGINSYSSVTRHRSALRRRPIDGVALRAAARRARGRARA